jgi:hypothetical protein
MEHTAVYIAIQDIIQYGLVAVIFPKLPNTLALLEQRGLLTKAEYDDLLSQAEEMNPDMLLGWWDMIAVDPKSVASSN